MFRLFVAVFSVAAGTFTPAGLPASAQSRTISECANALVKRGFTITRQDVTKDNLFEGVYEYDAAKNNEKWEFKMDENCKILYEHRDY
tara:strand:- start:390 stop:653 length:264 start_codon:yes stop_codon:yes gene_type:complete